jgi:lipoprotein-anchoring transpeptidase ErfK/SrfK
MKTLFALVRARGFDQRVTHPRSAPSRHWYQGRRRLLPMLLATALALLLVLEISGWMLARRASPAPAGPAAKEEPLPSPGRLAAAAGNLQRRLAALAPKGVFVVVDTAGNRVYLRQGNQLLRAMVASCGSGNVLEDPVGGRTWTFETPRGVFSVQSKVNNPVWIKPDWAYLEEGEAIPRDQKERAQPGMLGDYAVGIGHGYFLHGTLYTRLLGRNVSHGCVRLGDEDLKALVKSVPLGTRVIIY